MPVLTVLVPANNEAESVDELIVRTATAFKTLGLSGELIFIDDGSTDDTAARVQRWLPDVPWLRLLQHPRNLGLSAALQSGFEAAASEYILFLPADLQSHPDEDIPKLYHALQQGLDVVAGWRQGRRGRKRLAAALYNAGSRWFFHVPVHDANWIKGFRREVVAGFPPLRPGWHRFLLHIAVAQGWRIGEIPTRWYPRQAGRSHYGVGRMTRALRDAWQIYRSQF